MVLFPAIVLHLDHCHTLTYTSYKPQEIHSIALSSGLLPDIFFALKGLRDLDPQEYTVREGASNLY